MHATAMFPLVSIVWSGCNRLDAAKASIRHLADQSYTNFELIVQAFNSTDGTFEAFQKAAEADPRIRLLPPIAPDPGFGLLTALRACRGEHIGFWPMQGRLLQDAIEAVVDEFARRPQVGAVCGQGFLVNASGDEFEPVDIVTLLFTSYQIFLPAGFFRRKALQDCGLARDDWLTKSIEMELCLRVATDFGTQSIPHRLVDCSRPLCVHDGLPLNPAEAIAERLKIVSRAFSAEGFFGPLEALRLEAAVNHLSMLRQRFVAIDVPDGELLSVTNLRSIAQSFHSLLRADHRALRSLYRLFCVRSHTLGVLSTPLRKLFGHSSRLRERAQLHVDYQIWNCTFLLGYLLKLKVIAHTEPSSDFHPDTLTRKEMLADLYALVASRHEGRGQVDLAIEMWERARPPDGVAHNSSAAQVLLKSPSATDASIAEYQKLWVDRHIGPKPVISLHTSNFPVLTRKVRIGYHCAFMDKDTIRFMMRNVMAAHDRSRFEVYGYSSRPFPADLAASFDVRRDTSAVDISPTEKNLEKCTQADEAFVSLVRRDEIDIFVELTGFSPGNRFSAMSRRCAPVQVSFLNHTGTSQVPNVDYIVTDEICTPAASHMQAHYSETLWRVPGCFFSFDYRGSNFPTLVEPPSQRRGYTTFGCFGHGGKLNRELIGIWAKLLHRCPSSVLRLQNLQLSNYDTRRFIASQFQQFGIASDRLVLAKGVDRNSLLDVYSEIDVSLDTWPYCGGNTIAEALWMGTPVVTLLGERFSARYGASLVAAAGCSDCIAQTPDQYVEIAASLADDLPRRRKLRQGLRQMSVDHGLADSSRFARNLEAGYLEMLRAAQDRVA